MDIVSPAIAARSADPTGPLLARPLTPGEASHLDRLRDWLREDGTDAHDGVALDERWSRLLRTHPADAPAPAGVAAAIGIAVGDLLVASVADAIWMMCPGPEGATPGVLVPAGPHLPVLSVLDAHARWRSRTPRWTVDYLERAAAHLRAAGGLPDVAPGAATQPEASALDLAPLTSVRFDGDPLTADPLPAEPQPAADVAPLPVRTVEGWTPTFHDHADVEPPVADEQVWAPAFVDHGPLPAVSGTTAPDLPGDGAPTPDPTPDPVPADHTDAHDTELWTPTFVDGPAAPLARVRRGSVAAGGAAPVTPAPVPPAAADPWVPLVVDAHAPAPLAHRSPTTDVFPTPRYGGRTRTPEAAPDPTSDAATATPGRGLPVSAHAPLTPEDLPHRPSERVQDLALRALELALDRAVTRAGGCAPFVLVREGDDIEVLDFEQSATGLALARQAARDGGYRAAAVAWTSPADDARPYPRVVVDASAPGRPGIRVAHSFEHDEHGGREIGGPQVVGQSAPVL